MIQKNKEIYQYSSNFDLNILCPNLILYEDSYFDYLDNLYTIPPYPNFIDKFSLIKNEEIKIAAFSNYLIFNIINNFLDTRSIIKKDIEDYYNNQILNFLKIHHLLGYFQLKYLAYVWANLNKTIDMLIRDLEKYDSILLNQDIFWSDTIDNYYHTVPYIGNKSGSIDVFLILQANLFKYPLYNSHIDYLKIPSVVFLINSLNNQNIKIEKLKILWLDSSDISKNFQYIIYKDIPYNYILDQTNILNLKNNTKLKYPNLNLCYSCPYFKSCSSKKILLSKTPYQDLKTLPLDLFKHQRTLV